MVSPTQQWGAQNYCASYAQLGSSTVTGEAVQLNLCSANGHKATVTHINHRLLSHAKHGRGG
eukprot:1150184-Pelagomonas_calceolata.AAC.1